MLQNRVPWEYSLTMSLKNGITYHIRSKECVCVSVCLSFRCQPYLRNWWSICYHIWYDDCLSYENASHIIILDLEWNNSAIWKNTPITHLCGTSRSAQAHKDMLTHITLIASMFFRKTCGVWLLHSNLTQATWVHQKCTICLRFFGFFAN